MRDGSVLIDSAWELVEDIDINKLVKLSFNVGKPEDLFICGRAKYFDKSYDRITTKTPKNLEPLEDLNYSVPVHSDALFEGVCLYHYNNRLMVMFFLPIPLLLFLCAHLDLYFPGI